MQTQKKRAPLIKAEDENYYMTKQNLKICNQNQDRYNTPELNDAFELQYYGFSNIDNLQEYFNINTLYLNNNVITKIQNLSHLKNLITLNLANNRITRIQNIESLTQIFILDLSGNQIRKIQNLSNLRKLSTFNISGNLLEDPASFSQLAHNQSLTCLNISNNPLIDDVSLYSHLQKIPLLTLFLKQTKFSRGVPSYRKQTICKLKQLTYLDDRPVTKEQRMLAQAWKQGGLLAEREARKKIVQTKEEKNNKILTEMMERSQKIDRLRDELFDKLTVHQQIQLIQLKKRLNEQKSKGFLDLFQIELLSKKIQQLEEYLKLFRLDVNYMNVAEQREVPNNLCERHEKDAIYIYGVTQAQLPKIKQVYYPDDPRPLIAKDFIKPNQPKWVENYDEILENVCNEYLKKSEFIIPVFNLRVHQFDKSYDRKCRRFKEQQLEKNIFKYTKIEACQETQALHQAQNDLDQLD